MFGGVTIFGLKLIGGLESEMMGLFGVAVTRLARALKFLNAAVRRGLGSFTTVFHKRI